MPLKRILYSLRNHLAANWFVCRITSGRKSVQYGLRFSYPLYISIVVTGILLVNPYILAVTALIGLFGILLPMHPFDYIYNYVISKLIGANQIPGRGSELQINSVVALLFNLSVIALIAFGVKLNYGVMAFIYVLSSAFFIALLLFKEDFSVYSFFPKKDQ